ncbi:PREDICTED: leucine-rich repeat extensin-like protein 5 isoform X2 [Chinchilla lanigera]|uniref:leucine-rich repeat extensin-like protein 5 isoform X2 n=1 Tax=Chinchilla lanigera TaxID=34839 RepID=UPI000697D01D|nr:PREDICTED: leucine-rich repeat extensin-like protein 5 isoform X2 [Chinchilla lanigera]
MIASRTPHPQTEAESPPAEGVRTHSPHLPRRSSTKVAGGSDGRTTPVPAPRSPAARWRPRVGPRLPLGSSSDDAIFRVTLCLLQRNPAEPNAKPSPSERHSASQLHSPPSCHLPPHPPHRRYFLVGMSSSWPPHLF